jgi:hypothetical protein
VLAAEYEAVRLIGMHRLAALGEISEEDLASLIHMLDALVAKNRLTALAGGIS